MTNFRFPMFALLAALAATASQAHSAPLTKTVTVDAAQGPWFYLPSPHGTNCNFAYGAGDQQMPAVVSGDSGFSFKPGAHLTIRYVSGSVTLSSDGKLAAPDASGSPVAPVNDSSGASGKKFPSAFFDHADYPARIGALVGVFTDSYNVIVGNPFLIGKSRTVQVPAGATRLEFGINDDIFGDNSGSFTVTVSQDGIQAPAAQPILASSVQWAGGSFGAAKSDPKDVFCLMATGFFQSPTSPDLPGVVAKWLHAHPKAVVVKVASLGPASSRAANSDFIAIWIVDGGDNLNLDLIRQGCMYPGTQGVEYGEELLAPQAEYDAFSKKANAAGEEAKAKNLGVWKLNPE